MSTTLRFVLFAAAVITAIWILKRIRKSKVRLEDAVFWMCLACALALLGIFPQIAYFMTRLLGIQSPANCIFLLIIALLIEKVFSLSIKLSQLEDKIGIMAAELAIRCKDISKRKEEDGEK